MPSLLFLPPPLPYGGPRELDALIERAYGIFREQLLASAISFRERRVVVSRRLGADNREETFWHLATHESDIAMRRTPDPDRCCKLSWVKPLIENCNEPRVLCWRYRDHTSRGFRNRHYIWAVPDDYVTILEEMKAGDYLLVTAFPIEEFKRNDLRRRYNRRSE